MADLAHFLFLVWLIFTVICILICLEAHYRYQNKRGIDQEREFTNQYAYFGQSIHNVAGKKIGFELLLREYNQQTQRWQLPQNVVNFPLSKMVHTIHQIDPAITANLEILALNMTVSQLTDFRAVYFFKWVLGIINQQQLTVEIDAKDLLSAPRYQQRHLQRLLKTLDHHQIQVAIENVDSSKEMYQKLQRFLPGVDFLKFRIDAFKKSENHWIDITLAQWQRQAQAKNVKIVVGKIETPIQVELALNWPTNLPSPCGKDMPMDNQLL